MTPTLTPPPETVAFPGADERCDRCSAAAKLRVMIAGGGELVFCGHHANKYADKLVKIAVQVAVDAVSFSLLQDQLQQVLQTLSEREAGVVRLRFGLTDGQPRTLDEIGQVYGVTRERIRQIESKTMSKLRHPSRSQVLRDYLD